MLCIPLNEGKVFLNVPLFKQEQLCLFIHLYTQDWFVAHMLCLTFPSIPQSNAHCAEDIDPRG